MSRHPVDDYGLQVAARTGIIPLLKYLKARSPQAACLRRVSVKRLLTRYVSKAYLFWARAIFQQHWGVDPFPQLARMPAFLHRLEAFFAFVDGIRRDRSPLPPSPAGSS